MSTHDITPPADGGGVDTAPEGQTIVDVGAGRRYEGCRGEDNHVLDVACSPDGRWLAVCEARGGVVRRSGRGAAPERLPVS